MQQGRLHSNKELKPLIETLEQREALLDRWRHNKRLSPKESQAVWLLLDQIVVNNTTRHYKRANRRGKHVMYGKREWYDVDGVEQSLVQEDQDTHHDRCITLATLLRKRTDKGVGWCITAYRIRFAQFECKREIESLGLGTVASEQSNVVKDLMKMRNIHRRFPSQSIEEYATMLCVAWPSRYTYRATAIKAAKRFIQFMALKQAKELDSESGDYLEGIAWHGTNSINPAP